MGIDIRIPIGLMFAVLGLLLTAYGRWSNPAIYARSLGININEDWGVVLLLFGAAMLLLGWRGHRQIRSSAVDPTVGDQTRKPSR